MIENHAVGGMVVSDERNPTLFWRPHDGKYYQKNTSRSKRKMRHFEDPTVTVSLADGQANFQMVLPMSEMLWEVAGAIEQTAGEVGLRMMKALIDEEVEQLTGNRYGRDSDRQAIRWGREEGHVIFAGRKVAMDKPRVRSKDGRREVPLGRWQAFGHPRRMEEAVERKILRRVSCRNYRRALDDLCDGYGMEKNSVSRQWKAASARQLAQLMERRLEDLDLCVILINGKHFGETMIITALGIDTGGARHVLGLWPGATENSGICGALLDQWIERGLAADRRYLFILDGSKALKKAVTDRFGTAALIQRCRLHKERNLRSYLPKKYHRLPATLKRLLGSTNMIESCFSAAGDLCRNVKRWRGERMAMRWAGAMLLEYVTGFPTAGIPTTSGTTSVRPCLARMNVPQTMTFSLTDSISHFKIHTISMNIP